MKIRTFHEKDASKVSSIIHDCFTNIDLGGHTEEGKRLQIEYNQPEILIKKSKTTKYYVATIDETIVGICGYSGSEIRTFFVDIKYQGKGLGKALLAKIIEAAQKEGLTELHLVNYICRTILRLLWIQENTRSTCT